MSENDPPEPKACAIFREAMQGVNRQRHDRTHPLRGGPAQARRFRRTEELEDTGLYPPSGATQAGRFDDDQETVFARNGLQRPVLRRLRRGGIPREAEIDLHGCRVAEAQQLLARSLRECLQQGIRCVLIIHGKGLRSPNGEAILKHETAHYLRLHPGVLAYCPARPRDGGGGALYVLLAASRTTA
ncbi:MAG: Smr/MutS family protein [Pseudomonadota bacterium]|nr:Smr/MutS family protein [Pseudomonadota bacterium]